MAEYHFVSIWQIKRAHRAGVGGDLPRRAVAELVEYVAAVDELEPGAADGTGKRMRMLFRTRLPYTLGFDVRVTRVHPPSSWWPRPPGAGGHRPLGAHPGRWRHLVRYNWDIRTTRRWMNLLAPAARPVFRWNHDELMRAGGQGLARRLGADLTLPDPPATQHGQARPRGGPSWVPRWWDWACWDGAGTPRRDEPGGAGGNLGDGRYGRSPRRHSYAWPSGPRPGR